MGSGLFMMLVTNHIIACCWFGVSSFQQGGRSWIDEMQLDTTDFSESYAASLHWSLTQFTPATNNINPESASERRSKVCTADMVSTSRRIYNIDAHTVCAHLLYTTSESIHAYII